MASITSSCSSYSSSSSSCSGSHAGTVDGSQQADDRGYGACAVAAQAYSLQRRPPHRFLTRLLRDLKLSETDRSAHELEVLLNAIELAGTVDQLNLPSLAYVELLCRRVQLILDANSGPGAPVWEGAEHFMGLSKRAKGISPGLQSHVAARLKEEAEVDKQRDKAREVQKLRAKDTPKRGGGKEE